MTRFGFSGERSSTPLEPQVVEGENQESANTHGYGGVDEKRAKCTQALPAVVAPGRRAANTIPTSRTELFLFFTSHRFLDFELRCE
jgi:hypothetical protein